VWRKQYCTIARPEPETPRDQTLRAHILRSRLQQPCGPLPWRSRATFVSTSAVCPEYPWSAPLPPFTRWHGTMTGIGLCPHACPTTCAGMPPLWQCRRSHSIPKRDRRQSAAQTCAHCITPPPDPKAAGLNRVSCSSINKARSCASAFVQQGASVYHVKGPSPQCRWVIALPSSLSTKVPTAWGDTCAASPKLGSSGASVFYGQPSSQRAQRPRDRVCQLSGNDFQQAVRILAAAFSTRTGATPSSRACGCLCRSVSPVIAMAA